MAGETWKDAKVMIAPKQWCQRYALRSKDFNAAAVGDKSLNTTQLKVFLASPVIYIVLRLKRSHPKMNTPISALNWRLKQSLTCKCMAVEARLITRLPHF